MEPAPARPIRLSYRLGPSDLVRALEVHTRCPALLGALSWAVSAGAAGLIAQRSGAAPWVATSLFSLAGLLVALVVTLPLCIAWRWHRHRGFFGPHAVTVDADGLHLQGGGHEGQLAWSAFRRWMETPQQFLLYRSRSDFVVVPKHAFGALEELGAFQQALRVQLGPPAR